jgi:alpha-L-fucosidase
MNRSRPTRKSASQMTGRAGVILAVSLLGLIAGAGHPGDQPASQSPATSEENAQARRWFKDAKVGLFIHWGIYSLLAKGEWVMDNDRIPIVEYAKLPPLFDPTRFDAHAWVTLAKSAGAKYITITAKHHDGFCMFGSNLTDYDIVDTARYHKDPLKALADACHQEKIKLFFYYSLLDWHHPDYFPGGKTGQSAGRPAKPDPARYVEYYQGQIRELCTNYGAIGGIWFDGWWDKPDAAWDLAETYRMIHELQPGALVGNNHHVAPFPGEDFQMFEQDLPGENVAGFNKANVAARMPLETCLTINQSWGYNARDTRFKPAEQLIHALLGAAGRGANLLINIGPRPDGTISPEFTQRLQDVGKWLATYGESVYGTRRGPIPPQSWGVSTARGSSEHPTEIYLHVFKIKSGASIVFDPRFSWTPYLFGQAQPLKLRQTKKSLVLDLPNEASMPIDTIVTLTPKVIGR